MKINRVRKECIGWRFDNGTTFYSCICSNDSPSWWLEYECLINDKFFACCIGCIKNVAKQFEVELNKVEIFQGGIMKDINRIFW